MKLPGILFSLLCIVHSVWAFEDLGPLNTAQKAYPEIFISGSVNILKINNTDCYVFSGEAEQFFTGEFAEPENELYEEATLSAKNNFFEYLTKKDKQQIVTMSHCAVLYQYNDKKIYSVVLFVPKEKVQIRKNYAVKSVSAEVKPSIQNYVVPEAETRKVTPATVPQNTENKTALPVSVSVAEKIKRYKERLAETPDNIALLKKIAALHEKNNEPEYAAPFYRKAVMLAVKSEYFDKEEKCRMILHLASLYEKLNENHFALKHYYLLLKCGGSKEQRQTATAKISKIRLKMLE